MTMNSKDTTTIEARQSILTSSRSRFSIAKFTASLGRTQMAFSNAKGSRPKAEVVSRLQSLYPNLNIDWFFFGTGQMLTSGDTLDVPDYVMQLPNEDLKRLSKALFEQGPAGRDTVMQILLEHNIDPSDCLRRYPYVFSILESAPTARPYSLPAEDVQPVSDNSPNLYEAVEQDRTDLSVINAELRQQNKYLRNELARKDAIIERFLTLSMKYIETINTKNENN